MTMSKVAKEQEYKLRRQFQHLQDHWDSYKQSIPRRPRRRSCPSMILMGADTTAAALQLLKNSPKRLMCSLQRIQTPAADFSRPKPQDQQEHVEVEEEIINIDRRRDSTSCRSGRGGGRQLLEAFDGAVNEARWDGREDTCSVSSSVLIQGAEAPTSSGSCSSCSACPPMIDEHVKVAYVSSSISDSSSSSSAPEHIDRAEIWDVRRNSGHGGVVRAKGAKSLLLLPIVMITLVFVFMLVKGLAGEEYECCIVPT